MLGKAISTAKKGVHIFRYGRKAAKPTMLRTKWCDPKLGNIEYLTPQGKGFSTAY